MSVGSGGGMSRAAATGLPGIVKEKQKKIKQNSNKPNKIKIK
jgi:hypothetical protein